MTIDPKAVEHVGAMLDTCDENWWLDSDTIDCDQLAESAIHAYHQYLESIGAKVLIPKPTLSLTDEEKKHRWAAPGWFPMPKEPSEWVSFVELPLGEQ